MTATEASFHFLGKQPKLRHLLNSALQKDGRPWWICLVVIPSIPSGPGALPMGNVSITVSTSSLLNSGSSGVFGIHSSSVWVLVSRCLAESSSVLPSGKNFF